ncbi:tetratricopeptide repeat protein [candidate division KSB1 bacterium]
MNSIRTISRSVMTIGLVALFAADQACAQDVDQLFQDGNRLYMEEAYPRALEKYRTALESGLESGELYYNIGNTYYKMNMMGKAILYYEKARRLLPDDGDLLNNLQLANINIVDRITPVPKIFYVRYWDAFRALFSPEVWKTAQIAALCFSAFSAILFFFFRQNQARKLLKAGIILAGVVFILASAVLLQDTVDRRKKITGVVMSPEVSVYASPTETGTELFIIHEGTIVSVRRNLDDWIEIRLADGKVGWIPAVSIEKI